MYVDHGTRILGGQPVVFGHDAEDEHVRDEVQL